MFGGKQLEDGLSLEACGISDDSQVGRLLLRPARKLEQGQAAGLAGGDPVESVVVLPLWSSSPRLACGASSATLAGVAFECSLQCSRHPTSNLLRTSTKL